MQSIKFQIHKYLITAILLAIGLIFIPSTASAETITKVDSKAQVAPEPTAVNYELPHPGMLPGNPLYVFKNLRDKLEEIITTDNTKKSEFYLLLADKQLAAALLLYNQQDEEMAEELISKSQQNLGKSIDCLIKSKNTQENVNDMPAKIQTSSAKQREEIKNIVKNGEGKNIEFLKIKLKQAQIIENRANLLN